MPQYEEHHKHALRIASALSTGVLLPCLILTGSLVTAACIMGLVFILSFVAGIGPDIDSPSSIPRRYLVTLFRGLLVILSAVAVGSLLLVFHRYRRQSPVTLNGESLRWAFLLCVSTWAVVHRVPSLVHSVLPAHRKMIHTLPFWAVFGFVSGCVYIIMIPIQMNTVLILLLSSGASTGGAAIHLERDGMLSIPFYSR